MIHFIPDDVRFVLTRLRERGYDAHCVGGCVRDLLLGIPPHDWDVCTSAACEDVIRAFPDMRVLETGVRYGTVTVLSGGTPVEVTTYRQDSAYSDHRRPDSVRFSSSLREDLARRDFTVNAMALGGDGCVVDLFGGRDDLKAGIIRCVGDPGERFREDALRILRALRFAARFGFAVEEHTKRALLDARDTLRYVSVERVLQELSGTDFARVDSVFLPVLQAVIPELERLSVPEGLPPDPAVRFAALLDGLDAGMILSRLKASRALTERVAALVSARGMEISPDPVAVRRLLRRLGPEAARQLCVLAGDEAAKAALEGALSRGDCWRVSQLAISGEDLTARGLSGKAVGEALERLLDLVIDGEAPNERDALLSVLFDSGSLP